MNEIIAYTDGACSGNPGPGGWGVVLRAENNEEVIKERLLCGGSYETTNNKDALISMLKGLAANNLSHLTPHPFKVFLSYSHPPVLARIKAIEEL